MRGIGNIRNLRTFDATAQLIHALVTTRLDFCQRIQNKAACMLKRIPRRNHITPVLRELYWLNINDIIFFLVLLLTHKAVNNAASDYLRDLIMFHVEGTSIRTCASFDSCLLCVPLISKMYANLFFDRSFMYYAPALWNYRDLDIRLLPFDAFKKKSQNTSLSEVLCKLILNILYYLYDSYVSTMCIYRDCCVYHYKSTELVSLYTLDIGLIIKQYMNLLEKYYIICKFNVCGDAANVSRIYK